MGTERGYSPADFLAKFTVTRRRDADGRDGLDGPHHFSGLIRRARFIPTLQIRRQGIRRLSRHGLHKCHGLRDQEVALLFPAHCAPQPAPISAKSRRSIKQAVALCPHQETSKTGWSSGAIGSRFRQEKGGSLLQTM